MSLTSKPQIQMITNLSLRHDPRMSEWHHAAKDALDQWLEMIEDEGVDDWERSTWTHHDPSWCRTVATAFGKHFHYGAHRIVFLENDFVIKIDRQEGDANLAEWARWKRISDQAKLHVFNPYCITNCGTVLIGEKLRILRDGSAMVAAQKQQASILEECPEVGRIPDSRNIENWGLRGDKVILLDCAGYC